MQLGSPVTEKELLQRLVTGDKEAFALIYRSYLPELFRFTRRTVRRPEDAEEIVQEVFTSLWVRRAQLGTVTSLRHYLYSAVRYGIIRYIAHQQVRKRYEEHYKLFETLYDTLPQEKENPEQLLATLLHALEGLPPRCRQAMSLRLTEGLTNGEIADRMGITKEAVKVYMAKAVAWLKERRSILEEERR